jgi:hypothetical protein
LTGKTSNFFNNQPIKGSNCFVWLVREAYQDLHGQESVCCAKAASERGSSSEIPSSRIPVYAINNAMSVMKPPPPRAYQQPEEASRRASPT